MKAQVVQTAATLFFLLLHQVAVVAAVLMLALALQAQVVQVVLAGVVVETLE
jgi:hypothetical protein